MPTKENILKEFEKLRRECHHSNSEEKFEPFISKALDTYGKEQREAGKKETQEKCNADTEELVMKVHIDARAQALDEAIAAVKQLHVRAKTAFHSSSWDAGYHDALSAAEHTLLSTLNALRKK